MWLTDTMLQPQQVTSPTATSEHSSVDQQFMDQFTQMRTMLSPFLVQKQETTTRTAICNYLASEMEGFEENDFQTFRHETVKLLSKIQSRAEEHGRQPQHDQQAGLLRPLTFTLMPPSDASDASATGKDRNSLSVVLVDVWPPLKGY